MPAKLCCMSATVEHDFGPDDVARFVALEHIVTVLWSAFIANQADAQQIKAGFLARQFSDAMQGALADGAIDAAARRLILEHIRRVFGGVVQNADTMDQLAGG